MSGNYIPKELRRKVTEQANHRCGYCLTSELIIGNEMDIEHIIPKAMGGLTEEANLWLSCTKCNLHKADRTHAIDAESGETVLLFNPRQQNWTDHFAWLEDGTVIIGKTATGRATVEAVNLNRALLVNARQLWVAAGWHPPKT